MGRFETILHHLKFCWLENGLVGFNSPIHIDTNAHEQTFAETSLKYDIKRYSIGAPTW